MYRSIQYKISLPFAANSGIIKSNMTNITRDQVLHLAALSNIQLSDEETDALGSDLERILSYITQLEELNTDGVEPTYQVTDLQNVWRDDAAKPDLSRDALLVIAPDSKDGQIKVPKVL